MGTDSSKRRRAGRMAVAACAGILLLSAAGCAAPPAPAPTSSTPTPAPVFASDEEALAAATAAYADYLELSSDIAHEGGTNAQRMSEVAAGEALQTEVQALQGMSDSGTTGVGELSFDGFRMQSADLSSGSLSAYLCLDVSGSDVVNTSGVSVLTDDRVERLPLEIGFKMDKESRRLLLERSRTWDGENFCLPK